MKKFRKFQIIYAVCCLVFLGWMINLSSNEFDRINGQYHRVLDQLDEGRIRAGALEELIAECRREKTLQADRKKDACSSWPPQVVEARGKKIAERMNRARKRAGMKLVLFYTGYVVLFLLAPPVLIYLLIIGVRKVFSIIKFVK